MLESSVASGLEAKDFSVVTPTDYVLEQNYPNPFNPTTNISFVLPINKKISLTVYNTLGQKVKTLVNNEVLVAGKHDVTWDGTNESGAKVASGMYMYTLKFGNFTKSKRMMLVK
jgi:flagellar hook assembly protein FlgD